MSKPRFQVITNTPWLNILIGVLWLILLVIIGWRYFNESQSGAQTANIEPSRSNSLSIRESSLFDVKAMEDAWLSYALLQTNWHLALPVAVDLTKRSLITNNGEITAEYDLASQNYNIFLDKQLIAIVANPHVLFNFELVGGHSLVIFDAETIQQNYVYSLLDFTRNSTKLVYATANYNSLLAANYNHDRSCVFLKFSAERKYSDIGGFKLYQYCASGMMVKIGALGSKFSHNGLQFFNQSREQLPGALCRLDAYPL